MIKLNNSIFEDLKCSLHSHIPWCCIGYYFFRYRPNYYKKNFRAKYEFYKMACDIPHNYIACKNCLLKQRIVQTKECKCFYRKFGLGYLAPLKFEKIHYNTYDVYYFHSKYGVIKKYALNPPLF